MSLRIAINTQPAISALDKLAKKSTDVGDSVESLVSRVQTAFKNISSQKGADVNLGEGFEKAIQTAKAYVEQIKELKKSYESTNAAAFNRKLSTTINRFDALNESLTRVLPKLREINSEYSGLTGKLGALSYNFRKATDKFKEHKGALDGVASSAGILDDHYSSLLKTVRNTDSVTKKTTGSVKDNASAWNMMGGSLSSVGNVAKNTYSRLSNLKTLLVGFGIYKVVKDTMLIGADFEHIMAKVGGVLEATGVKFEMLKNRARELAQQYEWTAVDVAKAEQYLGMAGLSVDQVLGAVNSTLNLATAGQIDLARAAKVSTNAMISMGMSVQELSDVNDAYVITAARTNTEILGISESMKYAAPKAKALGYSLQELLSMIGMLGNAGVEGCYDPETEVLTQEGWKKWEDVTEDDLFATVNPETNCIEYHKPTKLIAYNYTGKMYKVRNKHINLLVTPNHNMYVKLLNGKSQKFEIISAEEAFSNKVNYLIYDEVTEKFEEVEFNNNDQGSTEEWVDYDGMVYCADVPPNHILVVRRGGKIVACGNSLAGTQLSFAIGKVRDVFNVLLRSKNEVVKMAIAQKNLTSDTVKLVDVLELMNVAGWDTTNLMKKFAERGGRAALILRYMIDETRALQQLIEKGMAENVAEKLANRMRDTVKTSMMVLKSIIQEVQISIFYAYEKDIRKLLDEMQNYVRENKTEILEFVDSVVESLKTLSSVISNLLKTISGFVPAFDSILKIAKDNPIVMDIGILGFLLFGVNKWVISALLILPQIIAFVNNLSKAEALVSSGTLSKTDVMKNLTDLSGLIGTIDKTTTQKAVTEQSIKESEKVIKDTFERFGTYFKEQYEQYTKDREQIISSNETNLSKKQKLLKLEGMQNQTYFGFFEAIDREKKSIEEYKKTLQELRPEIEKIQENQAKAFEKLLTVKQEVRSTLMISLESSIGDYDINNTINEIKNELQKRYTKINDFVGKEITIPDKSYLGKLPDRQMSFISAANTQDLEKSLQALTKAQTELNEATQQYIDFQERESGLSAEKQREADEARKKQFELTKMSLAKAEVGNFEADLLDTIDTKSREAIEQKIQNVKDEYQLKRDQVRNWLAEENSRLEGIFGKSAKENADRLVSVIDRAESVEIAKLRNTKEELQDQASRMKAVVTQYKALFEYNPSTENLSKAVEAYKKWWDFTQRKDLAKEGLPSQIIEEMKGSAVAKYTDELKDNIVAIKNLKEEITELSKVLSSWESLYTMLQEIYQYSGEMEDTLDKVIVAKAKTEVQKLEKQFELLRPYFESLGLSEEKVKEVKDHIQQVTELRGAYESLQRSLEKIKGKLSIETTVFNLASITQNIPTNNIANIIKLEREASNKEFDQLVLDAKKYGVEFGEGFLEGLRETFNSNKIFDAINNLISTTVKNAEELRKNVVAPLQKNRGTSGNASEIIEKQMADYDKIAENLATQRAEQLEQAYGVAIPAAMQKSFKKEILEQFEHALKGVIYTSEDIKDVFWDIGKNAFSDFFRGELENSAEYFKQFTDRLGDMWGDELFSMMRAWNFNISDMMKNMSKTQSTLGILANAASAIQSGGEQTALTAGAMAIGSKWGPAGAAVGGTVANMLGGMFDIGGSKAKARRERRAQRRAALAQARTEFNDQLGDLLNTGNEENYTYQMSELADKYNKLAKEALALGLSTDKVTQAYVHEREELQKNFLLKKDEFVDTLMGAIDPNYLESYTYKLEEINEKYRQQAETAEDYGVSLSLVEQARIAEIKALDDEVEALQRVKRNLPTSDFESLLDSITGYQRDKERRNWTIEDYINRQEEIVDAISQLDQNSYDYYDKALELYSDQFEVLKSIEEIQSNLATTLVDSFFRLDDLLQELIGGQYAPVQSQEYFSSTYSDFANRIYSYLSKGELSSKEKTELAVALSDFTDFAPDYIEFMKAYDPDNYSIFIDTVTGLVKDAKLTVGEALSGMQEYISPEDWIKIISDSEIGKYIENLAKLTDISEGIGDGTSTSMIEELRKLVAGLVKQTTTEDLVSYGVEKTSYSKFNESTLGATLNSQLQKAGLGSFQDVFSKTAKSYGASYTNPINAKYSKTTSGTGSYGEQTIDTDTLKGTLYYFKDPFSDTVSTQFSETAIDNPFKSQYEASILSQTTKLGNANLQSLMKQNSWNEYLTSAGVISGGALPAFHWTSPGIATTPSFDYIESPANALANWVWGKNVSKEAVDNWLGNEMKAMVDSSSGQTDIFNKLLIAGQEKDFVKRGMKVANLLEGWGDGSPIAKKLEYTGVTDGKHGVNITHDPISKKDALWWFEHEGKLPWEVNNMTGAPFTFSFFKKGGLTTGPSIVGEHKPEWVIPTYQPESRNFLRDVGADPIAIGDVISERLKSLQNGGINPAIVPKFEIPEISVNPIINIDPDKIGKAIAEAILDNMDGTDSDRPIHIHTHINLNEREIGYAVAKQALTNSDMVNALKKVI